MASDRMPDGPVKREFDRVCERLDEILDRLDRIERAVGLAQVEETRETREARELPPVVAKPVELPAVPSMPVMAAPVADVSAEAASEIEAEAEAETEAKTEVKTEAKTEAKPEPAAELVAARLGDEEDRDAHRAKRVDAMRRVVAGDEVDRPALEAASEAPRELDAMTLENFLGGRVAAWVGAVVVVIAAGFFVKFAYDQGWIQATPPAMRLAIAAIFGGLFLAGGEFSLRRFGRPAAVGAFGAGIGTLLVTALASARPLDVLSEPAALLVTTLVAALGIGVAWRSRSIAVGALAIFGGLFAPIILGVLTTPGLALPFHLTAVLGLGLGISAIAERPFRPLRWMTIAGAIVACVPWFISVGRHSPGLSMPIVTIWWAMVIAESAWAAMRGQTLKANVLAAIVATGAATSTGSLAVYSGSPWASPFGYAPFLLAALAWLAAWQLSTIGMPDDAESEEERAIGEAVGAYAKTLRILTGALLVAGVGLLFRYGGLAVTWAAMAVGFVEIGRANRSRSAFLLGLYAARGAVIALVATMIVGFLRGPARFDFGHGFRFVLPDGWWALPVVVATCVAIGTRWMRFDHQPRERSLDWGDSFTALAVLLSGVGCLAFGRDFGISTLFVIAAAPATLALYAERPSQYATRVASFPVAVALLALSAIAWWLAAFSGMVTLGLSWISLAIPLAIAFLGFLLGPAAERRGYSDQPSHVGTMVFLAVAVVIEIIGHRASDDLGEVARSLRLASLVLGWGALLATVAGVSLGRSALTTAGLGILTLAGMAWCAFGTLMPRLDQGIGLGMPPAWPILNMASMSGLGLALAAFLAAALLRTLRSDHPGAARPPFGADAAAIVGMAVAFLVGTLDAERIADAFIRSGHAGETLAQSLVSVWWGLCAIGSIVAGFLRQSGRLRWTGLILLSVTVAKVLLVDMSSTATIWRVVALLAVGVVLVVTSVLYVRVMPKSERA